VLKLREFYKVVKKLGYQNMDKKIHVKDLEKTLGRSGYRIERGLGCP